MAKENRFIINMLKYTLEKIRKKKIGYTLTVSISNKVIIKVTY